MENMKCRDKCRLCDKSEVRYPDLFELFSTIIQRPERGDFLSIHFALYSFCCPHPGG